MQAIEFIGFDFVEFSGYNNVAEANDLIILYPQVNATDDINPRGCWDYWGYTDDKGIELFSTNLGP